LSDPAFTILLPVHRPPALLPYAVASVQAQTRQDFELFIICDGAPPETAACAREHAARDPRIRVFEHPKGERHGEAYRHLALEQARGEYVCQIADDDLWLPNHLAELAILLRSVDFGHTLMVWILPDETAHLNHYMLSDAPVRQRMLRESWNFFGPTTAGYRLSAYRSLPIGWSPGPDNMASDLYMWRKFLVRPDITVGTRRIVTSVHFATPHRRDWTLERREAEMSRWSEQLADPIRRRKFLGALPRVTRDKRGFLSRRLARPLRTFARRLGWKPRA
jgi:glycosyltransferase involved in cell wall biosynthesis